MQSPGKDVCPVGSVVPYERHRPATTRLYQLVKAHYPVFVAQSATRGTPLPSMYNGSLQITSAAAALNTGSCVCAVSHATERLVAFSCKRRRFCPSCGARRMAESAALLVDEVLPGVPMRQWVLSFPLRLRFLFASRPKIMGKVLGIVYRVLATYLIHKAGFTQATARTGAVTLIQRFGAALNLNVHFHMLLLDGVYVDGRQALGFAGSRHPQAPNCANCPTPSPTA